MKGPVGWCRMPSASVVKLGVPMAVAPWIVSDELWELIEPLLPKTERRFRYPGRKRFPDRQALQGILFVLHTGVAWTQLGSADDEVDQRLLVDVGGDLLGHDPAVPQHD